MTLKEIKQLVALDQYRYSEKVREAIEEGFFEEEDLVHCILSATRIHKKERDELKQAIHGMKYVILGRDTHGQPFYTVGKGVQGAKGKLYFYISAHQADHND
jgi:flavorubredoxin